MGGLKTLTLVLSVASAPVAAAAPPLGPSGKWVVEYADDACVLQRSFGEGGEKTTFGLRPARDDSGYEVIVVTSGEARRATSGVAHMRFLPGNERVEADYISGPLEGRSDRITTFPVAWSGLSAIRTAQAVSVEAGQEVDVTLALDQVAPALDALATCQTDLNKG